MSVASWMRVLPVLTLSSVVLFSASACGLSQTATTRPEVRVAIGMPISELYSGSTFPFESRSEEARAGAAALLPQAWLITESYDLTYVYGNHELREMNLGGDNYLLAITTDTVHGRVSSIHITFQNRALTLDQALALAERLEAWFVDANFRRAAPRGRWSGSVAAAFYIERQGYSAAPYSTPITDYEGARRAFLDAQAQIIEIVPFVLEAPDVTAGFHIVNARRQREDISGERLEENADTEAQYFVTLSISAVSGGSSGVQ